MALWLRRISNRKLWFVLSPKSISDAFDGRSDIGKWKKSGLRHAWFHYHE
jgi:hypothetical protein